MVRDDKKCGRFSAEETAIINQFDTLLMQRASALIKSDKFAHLRIGYRIDIIAKESDPVRISHNASFGLSGSMQLLESLTSFIQTQDEVEKCLHDNSLLITFDFKKSETKPEEKPATNSEKKSAPAKTDAEKNTGNKILDETPDFFPVVPRFSFDQIILSDNIRKEILDSLKVLQCKDLIYNQWGFGEVDAIPRSILNFYGEPGTGKTMCAHAIAKHLGKKLLALNYAEIESKYVGEAPKNLMKAFEVAKTTDSVLFFDEADSFCGKRVQNVSHGSDQALNSLRSQMLILLEEHPGVVLFATNLVTNFDHAFESRILKHIKFELPNREARAAIIKKMLPSRLPIDTPFTEENFLEASDIIDGFSGREIKGAILDMLLSKAQEASPDSIRFSFTDLKDILSKKKKAKDDLKAEETREMELRITRKLEEKAAEAKAERELKSKQAEEDCKQEAITLTEDEQEYLNECKERRSADGSISEKDRTRLVRLQKMLAISDERASQIESMIDKK